MEIYQDSVAMISILSIILGFLVVCFKIIFQSKCKHVDCCYGLCNIERAVELENNTIDEIPSTNNNTLSRV